MRSIKIIVDSTVDLTKEIYEENDIRVIPLSVNFGEEVFEDGVTITPDEIYERVANGSDLPKTAAIAPQTFIDVFKEYIDKDMDILVITIGAQISTTYRNAVLASEEFPKGRIYVLDGNTLSSGTGALVCKAVQLRGQGKTIQEIFDELERVKPTANCQFAVETLTYLHKGGRCSGATKLFGHLFHIHPVIKMTGGKMIVYKKPRGKMTVALDALTEDIKNDLAEVDTSIPIFITHSGASDEVINYLFNKLAELLGPEHLKVTRASSVISCHCGPGTIGTIYIKK